MLTSSSLQDMRNRARWPEFALLSLILGVVVVAIWPDLALAQSVSAQVHLDPTFRTPAPPNDAFPQNAEHVLNGSLAMLIAGILMACVAMIDAVRFKSTVPLALVLGAAICVYPESIDNYLAGCFWSTSHDPDHLLYFLMGREFDYYVAVMWWAFGTVLGYIFYKGLLKNVTTGGLWIAFGLSGLADIIMEELLLRYGGIYTYFGHQPLVLLGNFPWWWLFVNVSAIYMSVAIAYRYREWFNGWKSIFILALMPLCYIGGFAFAGLPAIFVIQGDFSPLVTQLAGILSCILGLIQAGGIMYLILGRNPLAFNEREKIEGVAANGQQLASNAARLSTRA
ncbi:hypothetical protein I5462_12715 [Citrobacter freundii]|uniref:hypothetical protein n=1 Tax=Citrobacter TaxID=544 RepID=UPI000C80A1C7|nr:hypothetical protein [Citrobacter freundii]EMB4337286.1 hypothetical protein [Citrobacter freundii]MBJ9041932.1 hypothetical protein [Citrobacter freundii]NTY76568.1 hypothetical protein [Citrobacter freundii]NUA13016.1 hypothetical protein [Citrobacter freundii]PMD03443.1 hypothetical protein CJ200_01965 [Citrobacter freundii]